MRFATPCTGQGFGIAFLEAAAADLPVIGGSRDSSVDALAEGRVGRLVDPHVSAIEAAVIDALTGNHPTGSTSAGSPPMSMISSAISGADGVPEFRGLPDRQSP
jgi:hypothetical protein